MSQHLEAVGKHKHSIISAIIGFFIGFWVLTRFLTLSFVVGLAVGVGLGNNLFLIGGIGLAVVGIIIFITFKISKSVGWGLLLGIIGLLSSFIYELITHAK